MGVSRQHDNRVGQREKFVCIVVGVVVGLEERLSELPNHSFDLLCFAGQSELGEQVAECFVELYISELELVAEGMENGKHLFVVLAEVLS